MGVERSYANSMALIFTFFLMQDLVVQPGCPHEVGTSSYIIYNYFTVLLVGAFAKENAKS